MPDMYEWYAIYERWYTIHVRWSPYMNDDMPIMNDDMPYMYDDVPYMKDDTPYMTAYPWLERYHVPWGDPRDFTDKESRPQRPSLIMISPPRGLHQNFHSPPRDSRGGVGVRKNWTPHNTWLKQHFELTARTNGGVVEPVIITIKF